MAYEFKKLSDVTAVEAITDKANVLIEENGVIKKVNKNAISGLKEVGWNDLKDKPFGVLTTEVDEIIAPAEVNITDVDMWEALSDSSPYCFEEGETYVVVFDGIEYKCGVETHDSGDDFYLMVGNSMLGYNGGPDTGEPFILLHARGSDWVRVKSTELGTHTISVIQKYENITKIDYKVMPEGYPTCDVKVTDIIPMVEFVSELYDDGRGGAVITKYVETFNSGEIYYIIYDGQEYECETYIGDTGDESFYILGNTNKMGFDNEYPDLPFAISTNREMSEMSVWTSEPGMHTISIYQKEETVTPIDSRFISKDSIYDIVADVVNEIIGSVENGSY